ncbi:MAG TPA: glucoamylase family protein, partial [Acidobacteriaceae bacterium]|nr:glucoamylase family protein [Acidobacteriaceae bacterium]
ELMQRSYATMAKLPLQRGHLYNWYTTDTLEPLPPITVSSVDSGNLVASLYTVGTGTLSLLKRPLIEPRQFEGLVTHLHMVQDLKAFRKDRSLPRVPQSTADLSAWLRWIFASDTQAAFENLPPYTEPSLDEALWWTNETKRRIEAVAALVRDYMPWIHPDYAPIDSVIYETEPAEAALHPVPGKDVRALPTLEHAPRYAAAIEQRLNRPQRMPDSAESAALIERLRQEITPARERLAQLVENLRTVSREAERWADNTDFTFLVNKDRMLLSIGYDLATNKVHWACYDMLASEARIATYIAVARGELSQQGWFKMSRVHVTAYGRSVLLSWTGTMFEYLMPALWMRSYPDTLLSKSIHGAVEIQRAYAREQGIPWGISESGYSDKTDQGHYHYQAYGIPQVSLKWDATAGPVVSPYSTFLALNVDPPAAIENLRRMASHGWTGAYGFYEAIDFRRGRNKPEAVREWMAHHQGMCIMGLLNLLADNVVQQWFYDNTQMRAVELLLHEKPIREVSARSAAPAAPSKKAAKKLRKKAA